MSPRDSNTRERSSLVTQMGSQWTLAFTVILSQAFRWSESPLLEHETVLPSWSTISEVWKVTYQVSCLSICHIATKSSASSPPKISTNSVLEMVLDWCQLLTLFRSSPSLRAGFHLNWSWLDLSQKAEKRCCTRWYSINFRLEYDARVPAMHKQMTLHVIAICVRTYL